MKYTFDIIYTSDTHGHVFPVDYPGGRSEDSGLLNIAGQVKKNGTTLVLDGGDTLQGTPLSQYYLNHSGDYPFHPMAEAFNALGCDYFTLGNHDFNFGYDVIRDYLDAMDGTCLCANLTDLRGQLNFARDTVHVLDNGLSIGITGIVTDHVNIWEQPQNLAELRITDPLEAAWEAYGRLKDTCDLCICIYHGGYEEDLETGRLLSPTTENIACRIARELPFDLLLTGHQHMSVEGVSLYGTYSVQPPANASHYIHINAELESGTTVFTSSLEKVESHHNLEPYTRLLPLEEDTQTWLDQTVGELSCPIKPEEKLDAALRGSKLAALFNAVQLSAVNADISCTSLGNIPVGLGTAVTIRDICGAYLFANTLVVLEVTKEVLIKSLERCASYLTLTDGVPDIYEEFLRPKIEHYNYDFYAGISYGFDLRKPLGNRLTKLSLSDGTPLPDRPLRLVTSNYRASGTGGYDALGQCPVLWRGAAEMPELIASYIKDHSPLPEVPLPPFHVKW